MTWKEQEQYRYLATFRGLENFINVYVFIVTLVAFIVMRGRLKLRTESIVIIKPPNLHTYFMLRVSRSLNFSDRRRFA